MTTDPRELEPGTTIGYHPKGDESIRQVGVVQRHFGGNVDIGVIVTLADDPGIEEKVRYEHIRAIEGAADVGNVECVHCGESIPPGEIADHHMTEHPSKRWAPHYYPEVFDGDE